MKEFTLTEVMKKFSKLPKIQKIDTLWSALDYMQQYNGRNRWDCVALAMGFRTGKDDDTYVKDTDS